MKDNFENIELSIAKPAIDKNTNSIVVQGNFATIAGKIKEVVEKYKDVKLTDDNVTYVKTLKSQFVSLRTGIERERKEYKKAYITPLGKLVDSMCDELQQIVAEGENALGQQLDAYDQQRKDELTLIIKDYINSNCQNKLRQEYIEQIEIKQTYYNKTVNEADIYTDIDRQIEVLRQEQAYYDKAIELIKSECANVGLVADVYIRQLANKSVVELLTEIKEDTARAKELKEKEKQGEKIVIGEKVKDDIIANELKRSTEKDELRTRTVQITYLASNANAIVEALDTLCENYKLL